MTDGAPSLGRAFGELWTQADRQRCAAHRLRTILAMLPRGDRALPECVRASYWSALDEATDFEDAERRLRAKGRSAPA